MQISADETSMSEMYVRRPAGAVATVMVSGVGLPPPSSMESDHKRQQKQEEVRARDPYELTASEGSFVTASFPFQGDVSLEQLSFEVGDTIKVLRKENMWSWGELQPEGKGGWFPHNYVGTTFKPLPGMHEMASKIRERREKLEAAGRDSEKFQNQLDQAASNEGAESANASSAMCDLMPVPGDHGGSIDSGVASSTTGSTQVDAAPPVTASDPAASNAAEVQQSGSAWAMVTAEENASSLSKAENEAARSAQEILPSLVTGQVPSLPPFFKGSAMDPEAVSGGMGEQVMKDDVKAPDMQKSAQIDGMGNAGEMPAQSTGCKCVVM